LDDWVRADTPSFTAAGVALARSRLVRPASPTGDADAEARVTALLIERIGERERGPHRAGDFVDFLAIRTRFFDNAVLDAIRDGIRQVVILGAGYDARALRFRSPNVRFFEVDHPATQADKRQLLAKTGAAVDDVTFVAADFTEPGLSDALERAGHRQDARTAFLCEGVLRYLPEQSCRELLRVVGERAAPDSVLAVSISTRESEPGPSPERERRLGEIGEPVLTVPNRRVALEWVTAAGWSDLDVRDIADAAPDAPRARLLVHARR
jgi:methyltransferase (TIGR00027 family)